MPIPSAASNPNSNPNSSSNSSSTPQIEIEEYCKARGYSVEWLDHPGLQRAVFLCIRYSFGNTSEYQEFLGYNRSREVARNSAAVKALNFFHERDQLLSQLDLELNAIQFAKRTYHQALCNGSDRSTATAEATSAQSAYLKRSKYSCEVIDKISG